MNTHVWTDYASGHGPRVRDAYTGSGSYTRPGGTRDTAMHRFGRHLTVARGGPVVRGRGDAALLRDNQLMSRRYRHVVS